MKKLKFLIKLIVSGALLFLLYRQIDYTDLAQRIKTIKAGWLIPAFAFLFLNTFLSSLKWRTLLKADGINQSLWRLFSSHLTGSFFSLFLPSTIGGDAYRIADIGMETSKAARTAASVLVDRLTGFMSLAIYGFTASFAVRAYVPNWDNKFLLMPLIALAAILAVLTMLSCPSLVRRCVKLVPGKKIREKTSAVAEQILSAMQMYLRRPITTVKVIALSFLFQLDVILFVWTVTKALALTIPFGTFFLFVPFITLMEMIPVSVFGIGLRDLGYSWFMGAVAVAEPGESAAAVSLIYVTLTIIYVSIGGILFIFRKKAPKS